jgi:hypothetical protein
MLPGVQFALDSLYVLFVFGFHTFSILRMNACFWFTFGLILYKRQGLILYQPLGLILYQPLGLYLGKWQGLCLGKRSGLYEDKRLWLILAFGIAALVSGHGVVAGFEGLAFVP